MQSQGPHSTGRQMEGMFESFEARPSPLKALKFQQARPTISSVWSVRPSKLEMEEGTLTGRPVAPCLRLTLLGLGSGDSGVQLFSAQSGPSAGSVLRRAG